MGRRDRYNLKYETLFNRTIELLKLVKSAIVYLINSVQIEYMINQEKTLRLPPIKVDTKQSIL